MDYTWDPDKARSNRQKHGVSFADAVAVFGDELGLTFADDHDTEQRFVLIGMNAFGEILVVVYAWRNQDTIRIISARKATRQERRQYEG